MRATDFMPCWIHLSRTFDSGFPDGLGTIPGATYWPLPGTQKLDWGFSQINLNGQFTASVLYDLPSERASISVGWNGGPNAVLGNWKLNVIEKRPPGSRCSWWTAATVISVDGVLRMERQTA